MAQQETVREPEGGTWTQRLEHPAEELGLGGVGDQQQHHIRCGDDLEHFAKSAVFLGEPCFASRSRGGRTGS